MSCDNISAPIVNSRALRSNQLFQPFHLSGVLLYEMAVGKMPFRGGDENELLWNVCYEQIHYPMFLTKELTSLLQLVSSSYRWRHLSIPIRH